MTSSRTCRYRLQVTGRLPSTLTGVLVERFGSTAVVALDPGASVLEVDADQAALRALLTLLWDVGHDVSSVSRLDDPLPVGGE